MAPSTRKRPAQVTDGTLTALRQLSLQRRRRRTWAWVAGAALVVGGGAIWMLGPGRNGSRDVSAYTVKADNGSLPGVITASGELEAVRRVNVSPKRQGLLQSLLVNEGDAVVQGQLLARMDPGDFRDRLDELEALRRQAQADYDAARLITNVARPCLTAAPSAQPSSTTTKPVISPAKLRYPLRTNGSSNGEWKAATS